MVQFERALVSFYRPSIVTFPLSLRVSEILPLMFSRTPLFHYPTSSLLKISPCSRRTRWIVFLAAKSEGAGLIVCTISFQDFQPMWSQSTNVTDGQTDGRHPIPIPRICTKVHCAVIKLKQQIVRTYIVLYISTQICRKLHPTLLMLSTYDWIFWVQSIFKLNASLHPSNWTVTTMFKNIRQLLQQLRLQKTNRNSFNLSLIFSVTII